jgi:hypothetical protein
MTAACAVIRCTLRFDKPQLTVFPGSLTALLHPEYDERNLKKLLFGSRDVHVPLKDCQEEENTTAKSQMTFDSAD